MSKKVLILSGSPRKGGNSETLCAQFAKGGEEAGHAVEMIRLHTKKLGFCTACYAGLFLSNDRSNENPH